MSLKSDFNASGAGLLSKVRKIPGNPDVATYLFSTEGIYSACPRQCHETRVPGLWNILYNTEMKVNKEKHSISSLVIRLLSR